ncbi:hypothetical protein BV372_14845, partial [Nostoc sp. T09]|uniref:XisH family protein n=1 Tax=Nostoc sp. T09 TaxID=1932621 RepID=UPI000B6FA295
MPPRDAIHEIVKQALIKDAWIIKDSDDPYVISYGERFLFVDLGASKSAANNPSCQLQNQTGELVSKRQ